MRAHHSFVPPRDWFRLLRRTQRRVNFGWFADRMAPLLACLAFVLAIALLYLRSAKILDQIPWHFTLGLPLVALGLLALIAWLLARRHFLSLAEAAVRLESHLGLHNALSRAAAGHGSWPPIPTARSLDGLAWRPLRLLIPPLLAFGLIAAALWVPLPESPGMASLPPNEPPAWAEMEDLLEAMQDEELADEEDLKQWQEKIEALRNEASEDWFSHAQLEATDSLEESLVQAMQNLEYSLRESSQSLNVMKSAPNLTPAQKEALQQQYQNALQNLSQAQLSMDPQLLSQMPDPKSLAGAPPLTPEQMQQLRENAERLRELLKQSQAASEQWAKKYEESQNQMAQQGADFGTGSGGINRGPGEAPMSFSSKETDLGTDALESVPINDLENITPGDLITTIDSAPPQDLTPNGSQSAGSISGPARGGERVWESDLLPAERAVLRQYFR